VIVTLLRVDCRDDAAADELDKLTARVFQQVTTTSQARWCSRPRLGHGPQWPSCVSFRVSVMRFMRGCGG
jgi:hypothetical protein